MLKGRTKNRFLAVALAAILLSGATVRVYADEMPSPVEVDAEAPIEAAAPVEALAPVAADGTAPIAAAPKGIVATDHQIYTYDEMRQDIAELVTYYPGILSAGVVGTTSQGREIPVIYLGNRNAPRQVMVQSSMHAREYMASLLTMAMVEYYASNYYTTSVNGVPYATLFSKVCFVILPMVNPDGVSISQFGVNGATKENNRNLMLFFQMTGSNLTQIKANANGIDINKNFPVGFGRGSSAGAGPSLMYYPGTAALSEAESKALATAASWYNYVYHINYHTMGNIIYYGSSEAGAAVNASSAALAALISSRTGYRTIGSLTGLASGTFADYVCVAYGRPSATIELGTANPVPIAQFSGIFQRNYLVWGDVAYVISANL